jgi:hypothetical protein
VPQLQAAPHDWILTNQKLPNWQSLIEILALVFSCKEV